MTIPIINVSDQLGVYSDLVNKAVAGLRQHGVLQRVQEKEYTLWKPSPNEIANRLGWLDSPQSMLMDIRRLEGFAGEVRASGYENVVLLGMGGSSLAVRLFLNVLGVQKDYPLFTIIDSTDPATIVNQTESINLAKTLFVVSTKSGTTLETISLFKYFYRQMLRHMNAREAGRHFVAITDPGSPIVEMASRLQFRDLFLNNPHIGGRYSALSFFGILPAFLMGIDVKKMLERTIYLSEQQFSESQPCGALFVGAALAEMAKTGRDKATFIMSPQLASLGDWLEQLIAESTGKEGRGILPVIGESLCNPEQYGNDRIFIFIQHPDDTVIQGKRAELEAAGHPVICINMDDLYDLGGHIFFWELATAVAGHCLGINPFDQPDVEASKIQTGKIVRHYLEKGTLSDKATSLHDQEIAINFDTQAENHAESLRNFLDQGGKQDYVALQAFLTQTAETEEALQLLRHKIRNLYHLATTVGYGPRYLHSTGQLHKGDAGRGLFVQLTAADRIDIGIPDEPGSSASSISFGILKAAQALGDKQALVAAGRRVITIDLKEEVSAALLGLTETL